MESFAGIEAFVHVIETGGITGAATALQTAKSSISDTIRALEERLGVRLLERTTRHVRPTDAGRQFYVRCRRLLDDADAARAEAKAFQTAASGTLRVAAPEDFGERFILPGLPGFLANHPAVVVHVTFSARHVRLVEEGFDLAIRMVESPAPSTIARRIGGQRMIVVATASYLSGAGVPVRPSDVARHMCVGTGQGLPWHGKWTLGGETVEVTPRLVVNTADALRSAALAGMGLVAVPDWMVGDLLASGALTRVLAEFDTTESGIWAVYPTNRLLTPVVKAFVDHIVRELRVRGIAA